MRRHARQLFEILDEDSLDFHSAPVDGAQGHEAANLPTEGRHAVGYPPLHSPQDLTPSGRKRGAMEGAIVAALAILAGTLVISTGAQSPQVRDLRRSGTHSAEEPRSERRRSASMPPHLTPARVARKGDRSASTFGLDANQGAPNQEAVRTERATENKAGQAKPISRVPSPPALPRSAPGVNGTTREFGFER